VNAQAGPPSPSSANAIHFDAVVEELRRVLATVRHGSVTLIVQDGRIVQIDTTQKMRVEPRNTPGSASRRT